MIFKLKCKNCGTIIFYDTHTEYDEYQKCSKCMQVVNMNVETKLNNIAELEQFEVIEVYSPNGSDNTSIEKAKAVLHPQLFGEDLKHLANIYENASIENKKILLNIVDKLYLMLNRKDINTYNDLEKIINDYFYTSCERPLELN